MHVTVYFMIRKLLSTFEQVTTFAFTLSVADKRISGIYVTFFACCTNMTYLIHKLYVFRVVDYFGIYQPQVVLTVISVIGWLVMSGTFMALADKKKETWHVSSAVVKKAKTD